MKVNGQFTRINKLRLTDNLRLRHKDNVYCKFVGEIRTTMVQVGISIKLIWNKDESRNEINKFKGFQENQQKTTRGRGRKNELVR